MIAVDPKDPDAERLWIKVAELAEKFGSEEDWCLVGGLMVQLYAFEHDSDSRPTDDIDVLANARARPSVIERISELLDGLGDLVPPTPTDPTIGYRFEIGGEIVEVLGPDGLRADPNTLGNRETIQVPGGTQALRRTERVSVSVAGAPAVELRRPTLLGAVLLKARALAKVRNRFAEHREDLIRLLSFMHDPRSEGEAGKLSAAEGRWL